MSLINVFGGNSAKEILSNLPDAAFVVDEDGKICWVNEKASDIFEAEMAVLKSHYFDDLVDSGMNMIEKSVMKGVPVIAGAFTPTDREFFVELNARSSDGQYYVSIRDVTAMTHILAKAEQTGLLNKDKNTMIVKLSGDFKSPLQSISGFSQSLLDGATGALNEKQEKYIKIINKNASELLNFMDKFIEFAHAESNLNQPDIQPFDFVAAIQSVIRHNEANLQNKNVTMSFDYESLSKRVGYSDESYLKTILNNVIETSIRLTEIGSIAIKVSNPDTEVIKRAYPEVNANVSPASFVMISVKDSGMGLTEADFNGLFEPYQLLDKSANKKALSRSFSLGTANTLLKKLNGALWAESEVMKGSVFSVIIPVEKPEPQTVIISQSKYLPEEESED